MSNNCAGSTDKKAPYSKPWDDSDAFIICGNELFHIHKLIVGMSSPVLKKMFSVSKEGEKQVKIPEKYNAIVVIVLDMIYPGENKVPGKYVIKSVLQIAEEYQIAIIKHIIDRDLCLTGFELEKLCLAEEFDPEVTRKACMDYLKANDCVLDNKIDVTKVNLGTCSQVLLSKIGATWKHATCAIGHPHKINFANYCKANCQLNVAVKGSTYCAIESLIDL